jgi:hypothetical protein
VFRRDDENRTARLGSALVLSIAVGLVTTRAVAVTTLTVDLATAIGPAKHVASGSLYGITETLPANVSTLIAPLNPRMFTNPASDVQQPVGDAIVVAGRIAATGATVTIRLADWLKGFYTFTSMSDWLDKVGQTVARRKAAGLTNIYGYEIWNEPGGTWSSSNPVTFNEFWRQTFVQLRQLDPGIKIIGPSYAYYNATFISSFLSFCKTNSCLPDIVSWHELGGGDVVGSINAYRSLEKQVGVGPLPISINEYSGAGHLDVEGQPGASAPIIAKFERLQVDSACISFWDVSHPGRLGSLLATNTDPNGGWWFYKWYGDMGGNMVSTTPPSPTNATALDGFANLDSSTSSASVLFGGVNDGTIQVVVKGFGAATFFGSGAHAVVERTPFVNRTTVVSATNTLSTSDLTISNNQITVSVSGTNSTDGYRLRLTPAGGSGGSGGTGGTTTTGGASATAGSKATGGIPAAGGVANTGGSGARGGAQATGGLAGTGGGRASGGMSTSNGGTGAALAMGGSKAASGGTSNETSSGGTSAALATGGKATSGGVSATGGASSVVGGSSSTTASGGGLNGKGGSFVPNGGASGGGGTTGVSTTTEVGAANATGNSAEVGGCGCRTVGNASSPTTFALSVGLLLLRSLHRRRRRATER